MSYYEICKKCDARFGSVADLDAHSREEHDPAPSERAMPEPGESVLDRLVEASNWFPHNSPLFKGQHVNRTVSVEYLDAARAELAAIRQRAADLEMMLRGTLAKFPRKHITIEDLSLQPGEPGIRWKFLIWTRKPHPKVLRLDDDGAGLPLLTDGARDILTPAARKEPR